MFMHNNIPTMFSHIILTESKCTYNCCCIRRSFQIIFNATNNGRFNSNFYRQIYTTLVEAVIIELKTVQKLVCSSKIPHIWFIQNVFRLSDWTKDFFKCHIDWYFFLLNEPIAVIVFITYDYYEIDDHLTNELKCDTTQRSVFIASFCWYSVELSIVRHFRL